MSDRLSGPPPVGGMYAPKNPDGSAPNSDYTNQALASLESIGLGKGSLPNGLKVEHSINTTVTNSDVGNFARYQAPTNESLNPRIIARTVSDPSLRETAETAHVATIGHELTHAATFNADMVADQRPYYREALAGLGEYKVLMDRFEKGLFLPAGRYALRLCEGDTLKIPPNMRHLDERNTKSARPDRAYSTNGLLAGLGVAELMKREGMTLKELMQMAAGGNQEAYDWMRGSVKSLGGDILEHADNSGESAHEVARVTRKIQRAVQKAT